MAPRDLHTRTRSVTVLVQFLIAVCARCSKESDPPSNEALAKHVCALNPLQPLDAGWSVVCRSGTSEELLRLCPACTERAVSE